MKPFLADLHIHTDLSPCAADEMTPPAIVAAAVGAGLSLIAICDHNAAGNIAAVQEAARRIAAGARPDHLGRPRRSASPASLPGAGGLTVLAGIEITTAEEVHVLGLFREAPAAMATAEEVQKSLPPADADYFRRFGPQHHLDAEGHVLGIESRMLAMTSSLDLAAAIELIHQHGGLAIAAHVNRPSFSVLSQLGMFPPDAGFDAIEVFVPCDAGPDAAKAAAERFAVPGLPVIAGSDSHFPADIGRARTVCVMKAPTFEELGLALRAVGGRSVRCA